MFNSLKYVMVRLWFVHVAMIIFYVYSIYNAFLEKNTQKVELLYSRWWGFPVYISILTMCHIVIDKYGKKNL